VALVLDELDRMDHLVEDLRLLARAERPDFLTLGRVDVAALTEELLAKARAIGGRRFVVEQSVAVEVDADRRRLTQAAMILIDNAVQMTGSGSTITIGSCIREDRLRLSVHDEGPGIPEAMQPSLFDVTSRPPDFLRHGGTGLGIPIALAIARAHGGTLGVRSRPGAGATFTIVIPLVSPTGQEPDATADERDEGAAGGDGTTGSPPLTAATTPGAEKVPQPGQKNADGEDAAVDGETRSVVTTR
jgi:signal transduction histidine kinase